MYPTRGLSICLGSQVRSMLFLVAFLVCSTSQTCKEPCTWSSQDRKIPSYFPPNSNLFKEEASRTHRQVHLLQGCRASHRNYNPLVFRHRRRGNIHRRRRQQNLLYSNLSSQHAVAHTQARATHAHLILHPRCQLRGLQRDSEPVCAEGCAWEVRIGFLNRWRDSLYASLLQLPISKSGGILKPV